MVIPRFVETLELNNALLVGSSVLLSLLAIWFVLVTSSFLLHQGIRASGIQSLASLGESLYKRGRLLAALLSIPVVLAGIGLLGYALWRGTDLQPWFDRALQELTPDILKALGRGVGLVVLMVIGFYALQRSGRRLVVRIEQMVRERQLHEAQRVHVEKLLVYLPSAINFAVANAVVRLAISALDLPAAVEWLITTTLYILLLVTGGRTLVYLLYFLSERVVASWEDKSKGTRLEEYYAALRRLLPVGQKSLEAITYISVATLIVRKFQTLEPIAPYGPILIRVVSMFFAASVLVELGRVMVARLLSSSTSATDDVQRRRQTFVSLLQSIIKYIIYFCVCMMVLSDFGVDPTPILAGAGIVGLTVGLGAQTIVQDLLNGIFLLFEDQILNGDYVRIGDTEGLVEEITPRVTRIRDRFGRLHIMRNGEIKNVINYSRGWTMAVVEMSVAYESDLRKALRVIEEAGARLPELLPGKAIETPKVMGIETIDDSCLRVRIETKVAPGCHYEVKRALHLMLVESFNAHQLEIPYPKAVEISGDPAPEPAGEKEAA
ncbi:mechanosensitive ion channel family protein [Vitiosangium sp. GDMCC 1.1324]|uniref:mechanosensitive ion channel family protein n=1 Tax=Vitiosangium sp. (strain GDMCC 1.1324) TaxID=2138576 RepID=UPI000D3B5D6D|nr:mechanosensitive ion channel family protein [Vitiosangium sp. GDMCC 1.1324]PTL76719.1 mechanosensitive ion channel protein [Vitiosangium sp. GDMCC 1.1324]